MNKGFIDCCSLVQFHPDTNRLQLFSSSLDCGIRLWDLRSSECLCVLQSHYSAVTALAFSPDGSTMIRSLRLCCKPDGDGQLVFNTVWVRNVLKALC